MVVMKHLLQRQQPGRPGSPPAWKCHDRFPSVIATVFLQRLKGMQSHSTIIRHPSPCTPGLAGSCPPPAPPCPLPSMGITLHVPLPKWKLSQSSIGATLQPRTSFQVAPFFQDAQDTTKTTNPMTGGRWSVETSTRSLQLRRFMLP